MELDLDYKGDAMRDTILMIWFGLIIITFIMVLSSCQEAVLEPAASDYKNTSTKQFDEYFPMKDGTVWIYSITNYGQHADTYPTDTVTCAMSTRASVHDSVIYNKTITYAKNVELNYTAYLTANHDTIEVIDNNMIIKMITPLKIGSTWEETVVGIPYQGIIYRSVVEAMTNIEVNNIKYENVYKISTYDVNGVLNTVEYFKPYVGMILEVDYDMDGTTVLSRCELITYYNKS